jgi:hypothetical protein
MPQFYTLSSTSGAATPTVEVKNEDGRMTISSDVSNPDEVIIQFWDGEKFIAMYKNNKPMRLTALNNTELVDGPGIFRAVKPANVSVVFFVGTETNAKIRDGL